MVAFNFQKRFADAVEAGHKRQTIRAKARCMVGDKLQLYTGQRTKACYKLRDEICTSVRRIVIGPKTIKVDGHQLTILETETFARSDGFQNWGEMRRWFEDNHGLPFTGWLIEWAP